MTWYGICGVIIQSENVKSPPALRKAGRARESVFRKEGQEREPLQMNKPVFPLILLMVLFVPLQTAQAQTSSGTWMPDPDQSKTGVGGLTWYQWDTNNKGVCDFFNNWTPDRPSMTMTEQQLATLDLRDIDVSFYIWPQATDSLRLTDDFIITPEMWVIPEQIIDQKTDRDDSAAVDLPGSSLVTQNARLIDVHLIGGLYQHEALELSFQTILTSR